MLIKSIWFTQNMNITETTPKSRSQEQQFPQSYYLNMFVFALLNVADAVTTHQGLKNDSVQELNEIGKLFVESDIALAAVKVCGVGAILAIIDLVIARGFKEPKAAEAGLVVLNVIFFLIALNNLSYVI